jgi:hypothetical protein
MVNPLGVRYKFAHVQLAVATATPVEIVIPEGAKDALIRFQDATAAWNFSDTSAKASDGIPMSAGNALSIDGPCAKSSIWVYQATGGAIDVHVGYWYPTVR